MIVIKIAKNRGDPLDLVMAAVEQKKESSSLARRSRDNNLLYDQIWRVLDVDQHERLAAARKLAVREKINLAVSNPCFELWALLHLVDWRAHISVEAVQQQLRQVMPGYAKALRCDLLRGAYRTAQLRAIKLAQQHEQNGNDPTMNPSTDVWRLVDALFAAARNTSLSELEL